MKLVGHFQRDFDGRRAAVGKEDLVQSPWSTLDQRSRETNRGLSGEPQKCRMRDSVKLASDCCVDLRHAMAVDVAPE